MGFIDGLLDENKKLKSEIVHQQKVIERYKESGKEFDRILNHQQEEIEELKKEKSFFLKAYTEKIMQGK